MKKLLGATLALGIFATLWVGLHPLFAQVATPPVGPPSGISCAYNSPLLVDANTGNAIWVQCDAKGRLILSTTSAGTFTPIPTNSAGAYSLATITASDQTILTASTAKVFLDLVNLSPTATVCINFGATATITGTVCAAGEVALPPLWHRSWEGNFVPSDAIHAIASAASVPFTIGAK